MSEKGNMMASASKTVLVVEDSPTQALSLLLLLENEGLNLLHAPDGNIAIQLAQEKLPDAVILDLELPGINGFDVAKILNQNPLTANIPIIMLTRHDDIDSLNNSLKLGAIDFIPKDVFANAVLLETLSHLGILQPASKGLQPNRQGSRSHRSGKLNE
jgi:putative two-component system response regulator